MKELLANFALEPIDVPMIICGGVLFYLFCKLFGRFVVLPYLQLFEAREAATEGLRDEASADLRAVLDLERDLEARLHDARMEALAEKLKIMDAAKRDAQILLDEAEGTAHSILDNERKALEVTLGQARSKAAMEEDSLVSLVLQKF